MRPSCPLPEKLTCPFCGEKFTPGQESSNNVDKERVTCAKCNKTFSSMYSLRNTTSRTLQGFNVHDERAQRLPPAKKTNANILQHSDKKRPVCKTCGKTFRKTNHLNRHMSIHGAVKTYFCKICSLRFFTKENLKRHELIHSTVGTRHVCKICNISFARKYTLKTHEEKVHNKLKAKSKIDNKLVSRKDEANKKITSRRPKKLHMCNTCGEQFPRKDLMNKHLETCSRRNNIDCKKTRKVLKKTNNETAVDCLKSVPVKNAADKSSNIIPRKNQRRHSAKKYGFKTKVKLSPYSNKRKLKSHPLGRRIMKSHICNSCGKEFVQKGRFSKHLEICNRRNSTDCKRSEKLLKQKIHDESATDCLKNVAVKKAANNSSSHISRKNQPKHYAKKNIKPKVQLSPYSKEHESDPDRLGHSVNKSHMCNTCGKEFIQKGRFSKHLQICNRRNSTESKTTKKLLKQTQDVSEADCPKTVAMKNAANNSSVPITRKNKSNRHVKRSGFKPKVKSSPYSKRRKLKSHPFGHCTKKSHICNTCGKEFIQKGRFSKHLQMCNSTDSRTTKKLLKQKVHDESSTDCHKNVAVKNAANISSSHISRKNQPKHYAKKNIKPKVQLLSYSKEHESDPDRLGHSVKKSHMCNTCGKEFIQEGRFSKHLQICNRRNSTNSKTTKKLLKKTHETAADCPQTAAVKNAANNSSVPITRKNKAKRDVKRSGFKPKVKSSPYSKRRNLKSHPFGHRIKKSHICNTCGKESVQKGRFSKHLQMCRRNSTDSKTTKKFLKKAHDETEIVNNITTRNAADSSVSTLSKNRSNRSAKKRGFKAKVKSSSHAPLSNVKSLTKVPEIISKTASDIMFSDLYHHQEDSQTVTDQEPSSHNAVFQKACELDTANNSRTPLKEISNCDSSSHVQSECFTERPEEVDMVSNDVMTADNASVFLDMAESFSTVNRALINLEKPVALNSVTDTGLGVQKTINSNNSRHSVDEIAADPSNPNVVFQEDLNAANYTPASALHDETTADPPNPNVVFQEDLNAANYTPASARRDQECQTSPHVDSETLIGHLSSPISTSTSNVFVSDASTQTSPQAVDLEHFSHTENEANEDFEFPPFCEFLHNEAVTNYDAYAEFFGLPPK